MSESKEAIWKHSELWQVQKEAGATFGSHFGWEMAEAYDEVQKEAQIVRTNVGLVDLSHAGVVKVSGTEAVKFLQGLVTNDVKSLERGKGMRAAFLTGHGKIRALSVILGLGEEFLIINDPQTHEKVFKYIFPFSYAGDFPVEDVSEQFRILSIQGQNSLLVLKEVCFEPVPQLNEFEWIETLIAGQKAMIVRRSRTGEPGYDILIPAEGLKDVWDFLLLKGQFHGLKPIGLQALEVLRIEAKLPEYGTDIDENNMMLEAGFEDAVSFSKGCYTGQEAVAMATYRGHVSKRLSLIAFPSEASVAVGGKLISNGKEVGVVSSTAQSQTFGKTLAMACVKYGFFEEGTKVQAETVLGIVEGEIVKPLYNQ
jgi:glycine cleavage system T protein